ncbi:fibroblast growth factor-binding protein 1-like [Acipenser oxyrinchus oxyrinchus]|uniref:Fibroblast growth factor-binding protein 1-like n=1 Tax=Acipenser oxyrinchus oxyrinchus TaxID=40147 RepID=A0AAD8GJK6_ACIOX|nr:fibroblast growth factor-binding protein 1-like [Acipenser oxyrinchus oxyrinchus]
MVKNTALILLILCLAQLLLVAECEKQEGGKRRSKEGKDKTQSDGQGGHHPKKHEAAPKEKKERGQKSSMQGKFTTKDKAQCTWTAAEGDTFSLRVNCKKSEESYACEYVGRPSACTQYASNSKSYWKQISRALKKQKNLCKDAASVLKAGMCKKAPRDSHFKLSENSLATAKENTPSSVPENAPAPAVTPKTKNCTDSIDQNKLAEEYCSGSWTSLCTFFISMVQDC